MRNDRNRRRIRYIYSQLEKRDHEKSKKSLGELGAAVASIGLMQALLLALRTGEETEAQAEILGGWLVSEGSQCKGYLLTGGQTDWDRQQGLKMLVATLIEIDDTMAAMALTDEAIRYLSHAKLVAGALKGTA